MTDWCQTRIFIQMHVLPAEAFGTARAHLAIREELTTRPATAERVHVPPPRPAPDEATREALALAIRDELPVVLRPDGVTLAERVPLLYGHQLVLAPDVEITRRGSEFTGWVMLDAVTGELLHERGIYGVSAGEFIDHARIVDRGPGDRFLDVHRWTLHELTATATPLLTGTQLMVGPRGIEWREGFEARFAGPDEETTPGPDEQEDSGPFRFVTDEADETIVAAERRRAELEASVIPARAMVVGPFPTSFEVH